MIELTNHYIAGGVYAKEWQGKAGEKIQQHSHNYDHLSYLACGQVVVDVEGKTTVFEGPVGILIAAGKQHTVSAITDCLWLCIHAVPEELRDEGNIVQYLIKE